MTKESVTPPRQVSSLVPVAPRRFDLTRATKLLLVLPLVSLSLTGFGSLTSYNLLPATTILDATLVVLLALTLPRIDKRVALVGFGLLTLFIIRAVITLLGSDATFSDFIQANKWIVYLVLLCSLVNREVTASKIITRLTSWLIIAAGVKYLLAFAVSRGTNRTGLFTENNFELVLFCGLLAVAYNHLGRHRVWLLVLLGTIVASSGSRSGSIVFVFVVIYAMINARNSSVLARYLASLAGIVAVLIPLIIFQNRGQSPQGIDRLNFLNIFLNETSLWSPVNWIFGTWPLTPLSSAACSRLSFYENLFSDPSAGRCYAVILHSFTLRVEYDMGLVGIAIAFGGLWWILLKSQIDPGLRATLFLITAATSLSVSGLNNYYTVMPLAAAILLAPRHGSAGPPDDSALPQTQTPRLKAARIRSLP